MPERTGIVILHWFTEDATTACLRSIVSGSESRVNLYVVDNGSYPGFRDRLQREFPNVILLSDGVNQGFAAGANTGARQALQDGCTSVLFLNSDVIVDNNAIAVLCQDQSPIVNPRIFSGRNKGELWFDAGRIAFSGKGIRLDFWDSFLRPRAKPARESLAFATACAMLIRKEVIERIGLFDDRFFAYGEDLDLSIRATRANFPIMINRTAIVFHAESHSVRSNVGKDFRDYYVLRNALLVLHKHFRKEMYWFRMISLLATDFVIPFAYFLVTIQLKRIQALIFALRDGTNGIGGKSPRWN